MVAAFELGLVAAVPRKVHLDFHQLASIRLTNQWLE